MNEAFQQFVDLLKELSLLFQSLIEVEEKKLEVISKNQVTFLEECMNQEQAAILKLRGFDQKREHLMSELGFEGLSLREIVEKVPDEQKQILAPASEELNRHLTLFKELSGSVEDLLQVNLHEIDKLMAGKSKKTLSNKLV